MGFDTFEYYLFLALLAVASRAARAPVTLLALASLFFYGTFRPWHLLLLLAAALVSFVGAVPLSRGRKPALLALVCGALLTPLLLFKYVLPGAAVPLGISFYTFHCLSYVIDVYRGTIQPEPRFRNLLLYVSFFPQLIAGPLTRASEVLPQLDRPAPGPTRVAAARIWLGLFKKLAIANVLGALARAVFAAPGAYTGASVALAIVAARYYVFADFSGYTDIAIGSAQLLGIRLPENFRRPFAAGSLGDYWRRWHITLQTWIRDYVFFPLATVGALGGGGAYPLVLLTFLLLGLWHGATWNFVLYGLWHGGFLVLLDVTRRPRRAVAELAGPWARSWLWPWFTFFFLVCPPTVFFLTRDPVEGLAVWKALVGDGAGSVWDGIAPGRAFGVAACVFLLEAGQWIGARRDPEAWLLRLSRVKFAALAAGALVLLLLAADLSAQEAFVYFRF